MQVQRERWEDGDRLEKTLQCCRGISILSDRRSDYLFALGLRFLSPARIEITSKLASTSRKFETKESRQVVKVSSSKDKERREGGQRKDVSIVK